MKRISDCDAVNCNLKCKINVYMVQEDLLRYSWYFYFFTVDNSAYIMGKRLRSPLYRTACCTSVCQLDYFTVNHCIVVYCHNIGNELDARGRFKFAAI
jgi:hypothetical protein